MTFTLGLSAATALLSAATISAQVARPQPQPPLPTPPRPAIEKTTTPVTLTGCIRSANTAVTTATAAPGGGMTGFAAHQYVLTNVEDKEMASNKQGKTYALVAAANINLGEHLGHRVQATGTIQKEGEPIKRPATDTGGEEKTGDRADRTGPDSPWPVLSVTSLMMVSSTCGTTSR